jgi:hypothetical protein
MSAPISTAIAIAVGLVVLLTYIINVEGIDVARNLLLSWAVIGAASALLIGVINLVVVHMTKVREGENALYSLVLVGSLVVTFGATMLQGPEGAVPQWIFQYIQIPIETSLMAVMAVTLTYASTRLLNRRPDLYSIIFVLFFLMALIGTAPFLGIQLPLVSGLRNWAAHVLAGAGARGILIGVGLGTVATGIRILIGADRPFGG